MSLQISSGKPAVLWHGSFFVHHSLGLVNRELVLAMLKTGALDVGIQHLEPPTFSAGVDPRLRPLELRMRANLEQPFATVRHGWPPDFERPHTRRFVMVQPWEFGSLPKVWPSQIVQNVDEVWVPSNFVRDCYIESGVPSRQVFVVPNGVNLDVFNPSVVPAPLPTPKAYRFLFIGGTIARKGIDVLLEAYGRAFTASDDASLIIKDFGAQTFYAGQGAGQLIEALRSRPGAPEVVYLDRELGDGEVAGLYAACDALVHPYRGEGYGLTIAEAMACGKPTVITGAGAAMDFASEQTNLLVPARRTVMSERRIGDMETVDYPWWYEPDVDALAAAMRSLYENPERGREIGVRAARHIEASHTWDHAAAVASERLLTLYSNEASGPATISPVFGLQLGQPLLTASFEQRKAEAIALARAAEWDLAAEELDRCLAEEPDDAELINAHAVVQFRTGDRGRAMETLERALLASPDSRDLRHNLAFLLLESGDPSAILHAIGACELSPGSEEVRRTLERARQAAVRELRRIRKRSDTRGKAVQKSDPRAAELADAIRRATTLLERDAAETPVAAKPRMARLSVVMIARNEERFLRECLESVAGVADEVVVVDTGSTDRTVEIATEMGARAVHFPWTDDFAAARNVSLDNATGEWALWLDADERLAADSRDLLKFLIAAAEPNVGGYMVNIRNYMQLRENAEVCYHRACRLFRLQPSIRFTGRIHEQNMRAIQEAGYVAALSQLTLDHYGYASEVMDERNKHERFIRMLTREVEESPDETYRTFHLFNLGNAYFTCGDMLAAIPWFEKAAEAPELAQEYTALMFVEWATALYAVGRATDALTVCDRAEELGIRHPSLEFSRGHAKLHTQQYIEAEAAFRAAIVHGESGRFVHTGDTGAYTFKAWYGLALALTGQDAYEAAAECCRRALQLNDSFTDARYLLATALRRLDQPLEARRELERLLEANPDNPRVLADLGLLLYEMGEDSSALVMLRRASRAGDSLDVWTRLGLCCERFGLWDEARNAYLSARRLAPRAPELLVNLGRAYAALGEDSQAIDLFTDAIFMEPSYANAYFNAADVLYKLGHYGKAAETAAEGLRRDRTNASAFFVLGNCYFQLHDYAAAVMSYEAALARKPDYPDATSNLTLAREMLDAVPVAA